MNDDHRDHQNKYRPYSDDNGYEPVWGEGGILSQLLRSIIARRTGRGDSGLIRRIDRFIVSARKDLTQKSVTNYFTRANLKRELKLPNMTWKNLFKGLRVMGVAQIEIQLRVKYLDYPLDANGNIDAEQKALLDEPIILSATLSGTPSDDELVSNQKPEPVFTYGGAPYQDRVPGEENESALVSDIPTTVERGTDQCSE